MVGVEEEGECNHTPSGVSNTILGTMTEGSSGDLLHLKWRLRGPTTDQGLDLVFSVVAMVI